VVELKGVHPEHDQPLRCPGQVRHPGAAQVEHLAVQTELVVEVTYGRNGAVVDVLHQPRFPVEATVVLVGPGEEAVGETVVAVLARDGFIVHLKPHRLSVITIESAGTMAHICRQFFRCALAVVILAAGTALVPAAASAAELGDYLWQRRPLLLFAPATSDPHLVETVRRIEASRCDFADRDMLLGLIVTEGTSTLDGQVLDTGAARRLLSEFGIGASSFSVLLIGKDGGEKLRVNGVPDLPAIYAVIDGMPMRSAEMGADPGRC